MNERHSNNNSLSPNQRVSETKGSQNRAKIAQRSNGSSLTIHKQIKGLGNKDQIDELSKRNRHSSMEPENKNRIVKRSPNKALSSASA
jgi:hypothetical protein